MLSLLTGEAVLRLQVTQRWPSVAVASLLEEEQPSIQFSLVFVMYRPHCRVVKALLGSVSLSFLPNACLPSPPSTLPCRPGNLTLIFNTHPLLPPSGLYLLLLLLRLPSTSHPFSPAEMAVYPLFREAFFRPPLTLSYLPLPGLQDPPLRIP